MRLWSIHPQHLDARGLVALWREGLLARAVVEGKTRGYRHHPQLNRFQTRPDPLAAIDCYLSRVLDEARARGYAFDATKIAYRRCRHAKPCVGSGQIDHEWRHLLGKLWKRDRMRWSTEAPRKPVTHPCLAVVAGPIESWERV
jgi:hypothetical protein